MYKIRLNNFEGPLDLLLFFIKRDELDIYDIPISYITNEFMKYLQLLEQLDLDTVGEFILMASTLMQIKVKMLLPKEINEKGEEIDPRADLVAALLEYKRYKEMAEELSINESNARKLSFRSNFELDSKENIPELGVLLKNITIYDLMKAFKNAVESVPKKVFHKVELFSVNIEDQINYIQNLLIAKNEINFIELVKGMKHKLRIIVTFIAMLELIKANKIGLKESPNFNDFIIYGIQNG
ncbi:MAG: segregation/condensation protein A [Ignavibacteriales bacterium CG_4_9_14_3_um_filter_34_10]|nr:MAG: segregation/condensation protein A [Ignavibacteriales bacterium CG_4_9_14_3_um_filter_34_10]